MNKQDFNPESRVRLTQLVIGDTGVVYYPSEYQVYELPDAAFGNDLIFVVSDRDANLQRLAELQKEVERVQELLAKTEDEKPKEVVEPVVQKTVTIDVTEKPETVESPVEAVDVTTVVSGEEVTKPARKKS